MMKQLFLLLFVLFQQYSFAQGVRIGTAGDPDNTAILDLDGSTGKGLLLPRLNSTQMNALAATDGMLIYNSSDATLYLRKNGTWQKLVEGSAANGFSLPHTAVHNVPDGAVLSLYNSAPNSIAIRGASSTNGTGLHGASASGIGVQGFSNTGIGAFFTSIAGPALVTTGGKVGFGTLNPTYPVTLAADGTGFVQKGNSVEIGTNTSAIGGMIRTFTNHALHFAAGTHIAQLSLTTNGDLGVGTSIPMARLHVSTNNASLLQLDNTTPLNAGQMVKASFRNGGYYTGAIGTTGISATAARLSFFTGTSLWAADLTEKMSILGNGNIGINNTEPSSKLTVTGKTTLQQGKDDAAVEISGAVRATGSNPFAFRITTQEDVSEAIIDHPACNGNSLALVFITPHSGKPYGVKYKSVIGKWVIFTEPFSAYRTNGFYSISLQQCNGDCKLIQLPLLDSASSTIHAGTTFNVMVINQ
jgi:hypothetical protein